MGRISLIKIKSFFLELLSFNSDKAKVINLSVIFVLLMLIPTGWLKYSPAKCIFKNLIFPFVFNGVCPSDGFFEDCNCPACGMTLAMSRLLHGDIAGAYMFNKFVFILFMIMVFVLIISIYRIIKSKKN